MNPFLAQVLCVLVTDDTKFSGIVVILNLMFQELCRSVHR